MVLESEIAVVSFIYDFRWSLPGAATIVHRLLLLSIIIIIFHGLLAISQPVNESTPTITIMQRLSTATLLPPRTTNDLPVVSGWTSAYLRHRSSGYRAVCAPLAR